MPRAAELPDDNEQFDLDRLSQYRVDQLIVKTLMEGASSETVLARLQADSLWPLGSPGSARFEQRLSDLKRYVETIEDLELGSYEHEKQISLHRDGFTLSGSLPHCFENGQLLLGYSKLKGRDLLLGWLCHLVAGRVRGNHLPTYVITQDQMVQFDAHHGDEADLQLLLDIYSQGCQTLSRLLVDPAFSYAKQWLVNRSGGRKEPLEAAMETFRRTQEMGFVPEWNLVFRDQKERQVLNGEFVTICKVLMIPLIQAVIFTKLGGAK